MRGHGGVLNATAATASSTTPRGTAAAALRADRSISGGGGQRYAGGNSNSPSRDVVGGGVRSPATQRTRSPAATAGAAVTGGSGGAWSRDRDSSASSSATAHRSPSSRLTSASLWRGGGGSSRVGGASGVRKGALHHHGHHAHDMSADGLAGGAGGGAAAAAVHVLDSGVNRTPLPLQMRQMTLGVPGAGGGVDRVREGSSSVNATNNMLMSDPISSLFRSSFMMSGSGMASPGGAGNAAAGGAASIGASGGSFSSYAQAIAGGGSSSAHRRDGYGNGGSNSNNASMELSTHSMSFSDARYGMGPGGMGSSIAGLDLGSMVLGGGDKTSRQQQQQQQSQQQQQTQQLQPMTEAQRQAWVRASTLITLRETPTLALYTHHDEVVPSEDRDVVRAVKERNEQYRRAEEQFRLDEGTKHQSCGTLTLVRPKKSLHCEVHPPAQHDAGALQVTPWMLRDEWAQRLADVDEDDDDAAAAAAAQGDAHAAGKAAGDGGVGDVDDELGDVAGDDGEGSNASMSGDQSTLMQSSAPSGSATTSVQQGQAAGGAAGGGGASAQQQQLQQQQQQWLFAESLLSNLRIMERAVVQNIVEREQLAYRGIAVDPAVLRGAGCSSSGGGGVAAERAASARAGRKQSKAEAAAAAAALVLQQQQQQSPVTPLPATTMRGNIRCLWCYRAPVTRHRSVTCMAWNYKEPDLLAVGYSARRHGGGGSDDDDNDDDGVVAATGGGAAGEDGDANKNKADAQGKKKGEATAADKNKPAAAAATASSSHKTRSRSRMPLEHDARGVVCCWSLKNPCAPELVLHLGVDAGVSSLAFSREHPSLLAVGNTEGGIVVYDMVKDVVSPSIVPTAAAAGLHTGAVWELRWVAARGKERGEFLLSISADGRVVQWAVGKTLERVPPDLMHLKRQPNATAELALIDGVAAADAAAAAALARRRNNHHHHQQQQPSPSAAHGGEGGAAAVKSGKGAVGNTEGSGAVATTAAGGGGGGVREAVLSRQCGGMTFDVCPADSAIYIVGTEDGSVYECNRSQTESHELDYAPHAELVYRVRWSPFSAQYFLTCSADWTTRLYRRGQAAHVLRFDTAHQDAVQDVAWSYTNPLCFATATAHGHVELWLVLDAINPRASIAYDDHRRLSCVLFAEQNTPVLLVGDEEGDVAVYLLPESTYGRQAATDDEQEQWLEEAISKQTS